MRTIEVLPETYNHIEQIANKLDIDIFDMLADVISDGVLEKYYEADLKSIDAVEQAELENRKPTLVFDRTLPSGRVLL